MKLFTTILILLFTISTGYTQDIIHFKNGRKSKVKVIHVRNDTIYYFRFKDSKKRIKTITANKINIIFFEKGMSNIRQKKKPEKHSVANIDTLDTKKSKERNKSKKPFKLPSILHNINKPFGIGIDVIVQDEDRSFTGLSLDLFVTKNLNVGLGYGYFFGKQSIYFNGKIVFNEIKSNWHPVCDITVTRLHDVFKIKQMLEINNNSDKIDIYIPTVGMEYMNKSGLIFDLKLGVGLLQGDGNNYFNSLALSFRVAKHI